MRLTVVRPFTWQSWTGARITAYVFLIPPVSLFWLTFCTHGYIYGYMLELRRNLAHLTLGIFLAFLVVSLSHALVIIINLSLIGGLLISVYLYNEYDVAFLAWLFARFDRPSKFTARGAVTF